MNTYKIKIKIIELGYTQKELANIIGVTDVTMSKWINGHLGNIEKFIKLMKILNLDIREL